MLSINWRTGGKTGCKKNLLLTNSTEKFESESMNSLYDNNDGLKLNHFLFQPETLNSKCKMNNVE